MTPRWDLIVIGGGSGGLTAVTVAARLGARVLLVDKVRLGGDCLHDGCVPSKALIASARLAHQMRRAGEYGLAPVDVRADLGEVMARIRGIQADIGRHESVEAMRELGVEVRLGGARFLDPRTVVVGEGEQVSADRMILATGSRAVAPEIPGLAEVGFLDHGSLFRLRRLPPRIAVVGGGPIGVEIGQSLARLGARVALVQRAPRLLEREEPEISSHLQERLSAEGLELHLATSVERVRVRGDEKVLELNGVAGPAQRELVTDAIFVAVGRQPSLDGLGLEAAGITRNARGIVVDEWLRTSQPHIYAVGDCNGGPQFTHWAEYEGRVAARNALFRGRERRSTRLVPWVTFSEPEVARVGLGELEAREAHDGVHTHRYDFARVDRALTDGEGAGFAKVVVDSGERILGAHVVGPHAGEVLAEWVLAMEHGLELPDVGRALHVYPTLGRINRRVADDVFLRHGIPRWIVTLGARFSPRGERSPSRDDRVRTSLPSPLHRWATWVLGALLVMQGVGKALDFGRYVAELAAFRFFPASLARPIGITWTILELASGLGLLTAGVAHRVPRASVAAALGALMLSVAYAVLTTRAYILELPIANCTCFGAFLPQRLSPFVLAQDVSMIFYAAWQWRRVRRWTSSK